MSRKANSTAHETDDPGSELRELEAAWASGALRSEIDDDGSIDDEFAAYVPRRRPIFPPSFLFLLAAGALFIGSDSIVDLRWNLFGPGAGATVELGSPGDYRLSEARDGARVRVSGFASDRRGYFGSWASEYEIFALQGLPILIQRTRGGAVEPNIAEVVSVEGRLIRLDNAPRGWFARLLSPASRYGAVRDQFTALGEIPFSGPTWLLLDGTIPRGDAAAIILPIVVVLGAAGCVVAGLRNLWSRHRSGLNRNPPRA